jgi:AcrR family transcriptional regulator
MAVTTSHLSRDERMSSILQAAMDVVMEKGIEAATITAIASRSGVSRQWLYDFFPDVDSILVALYEETQREYFRGATPDEPGPATMTELAVRESLHLLAMPVGFSIVTSYALNGGSAASSSGSTLRRLIIESYEEGWVTPLVALGFSREEVFASIIAITNAVAGLAIAVHEGLTTMEHAQERVRSIVEAIVGDSEGITTVGSQPN